MKSARVGAYLALVLVGLLAGATPAYAVSPNLVISQVYGGGGNTGAPLTNDYIEIFNRGTAAADLTGSSVQYASSAGSTWQKTDLSGQLLPGQHYLVQEAAGANPAVALPTPDASGNIAMSATSGKVALVANQTLLTCGATADCFPNATITDFVGYGAANNFEGSGPAPTLSNTTAALRSDQGCIDTDNNAVDFIGGAPTPRNTASGAHSCAGDDPPAVTSTSPADGATNVPVSSDLTVNFSEPVVLATDWFGIFCGTSLAHTAVVTGGPQSFTINPDTDFAPSETCTLTVKADHVTDQDMNDPPDNMVANTNVTFATTASPGTPNGVVISQVYGGGGNTAAPFTNDFIELFNRSSVAVSLSGASVQYASAAGVTWLVTPLTSVTLQPKQYYLVQEAAGAGAGVALPTPDATGTTNMGAAAGKVALVGGTAALTSCTGAVVADLVGYGTTASCFEGAGPAPAPSNTTAAYRNGNGCVDTDNNAADFAAIPPQPRNTASPFGDCDDQPPSVSNTTPASGAVDVAVTANITIQFSETVNVADGWYSISCGTSGTHTAAVSGGPQSFMLNPDSDFAIGETCTITIVAANVTDQDTSDPPDAMSGNYVWSFTTEAPPPPPVAIHEIQGASHTSPKVGQAVSNVNGIVTAKRSNGYYMQDPNPDADDATSEGIFVFTSSAPSSVNVGDAVRVNGTVAEFRPGGASSTNLTSTEITSPTTSVLSTGNPLPAATIIGSGGRVPPDAVIEDDATSDVETSGVFDPASDGIDFYESLEGMLLQVNRPVVVGPRNSFGEIWVLADNGTDATARTARGGIVVRDLGPEPPGDYASGDFNPERVQLDDAAGVPTPDANVGDHFTTPVIGVLDYDFGNFELELTSPLTRVADGVTREVTAEPGANELTVATFNVENLDALEPQSKFDALAGEIVTNMRSPDVISLEEIQDNNGATNDTVVDADQTLNKLAAAIKAAGGPTYDWRQINPVDDQDGGEPGGNIRVGFMFRTDRGLAFVDRPGGTSTNATAVVSGASGPELTFSPGRIDPTNAAWNSSRKPLAGEFTYHGQKFFLITNHFNSKGGDEPLFGRSQPPTRSSEVQRHQQAQIVNNFVDSILAADSNANVVVLGDLNDFEFSQTVSILEGGVLHALMKTLPQNERYSYVFEGNSQSLDHIVVSDHLFGSPFAYDPVHVNAEFFDQLSDHDPQVARFVVIANAAPSADAGGPYTVAEGGTVPLSATGSDPENGPLTYAWDLDDNGSFETSGQNVTFSAAGLDGPSAHTVSVQVTDSGGLTATDTATLNVTNVAPQATFSAPTSAFAGFAFTISVTNPTDPSTADTTAGFTYAFDCGDGAGYGSFGTATSTSCTALDVGTVTVRAKIRDKDNGERPFSAPVEVTVTYASLCALVRSYTSDQALADQLCQRLEQARTSPSANAKVSHLKKFRDLVDKSGAFTPTQAETLKRLSTRL